jgi:hypothetical protein
MDYILPLFVCAVLLVLLLVGVWLRVKHTPPTTAIFANFSITVNRVSQEDTYLVYYDKRKNKRLLFYAASAQRKQACLTAPTDLSEEEFLHILPNLTLGLAKLGFQGCRISRGGAQVAIG